MIKILSQEQLDELIEENSDKSLDYLVRFNYGLRSSKTITSDGL